MADNHHNAILCTSGLQTQSLGMKPLTSIYQYIFRQPQTPHDNSSPALLHFSSKPPREAIPAFRHIVFSKALPYPPYTSRYQLTPLPTPPQPSKYKPISSSPHPFSTTDSKTILQKQSGIPSKWGLHPVLALLFAPPIQHGSSIIRGV